MHSTITKCIRVLQITALLSTTPVMANIVHDVPALPISEVATESTIASTFYSAVAASIVMLMVTMVLFRLWDWVAYSTLVLLGLIYICFYEQNLTGVIWTGYDVTEANLLMAGYAMYSVNFLVAANAIPSVHRFAWVKKLYFGMSILVWSFWLLGSLLGGDIRYLVFAIAGFFVALAHFLPVSILLRQTGGYDPTVRNTMWVVLSLALIAAVWAVSSVSTGQTVIIAAVNRTVIAAISVAFAFLFVRYIFALKSEQELAVKNELAAAEEKVRVTQELIVAREKYDEAQTLARNRTLRLARVSHDIRQPIYSLRANFEAMAREQPPEVWNHLKSSLNYLDELAASYMGEGKGLDHLTEHPSSEDPSKETNLETELVAHTLQGMFEKDARDRGFELKLNVESDCLQVNALALMRIMSNLMTNAIKHSEGQEIILDGYSRGQRFVFSVTNNSGRSLAAKKWGKRKDSRGTGLGLAIVKEQADMAGLEVQLHDAVDGQITVTVSVPRQAKSLT